MNSKNMEDTELAQYYETALKLTKAAGKIIRDAIKKAKTIEIKTNPRDLVTETDKAVEDFLIKCLSESFPNHKFIGEETAATGVKYELTDAPTWIIDPVDGTMNFVHSFPHTCISIGLYVNKVGEIGIVYNPILEQLFTAQRGKGAFLNGERIKVSGQKDLSQALVLTEMGTRNDPAQMDIVFRNVQTIMKNAHGVRFQGSAALNMCYVSAGFCEAFYYTGLQCWDMAAGEVIVTEAGGVIMDVSGKPFDLMSRRLVCASSKEIADKLVSLLEVFDLERD